MDKTKEAVADSRILEKHGNKQILDALKKLKELYDARRIDQIKREG